MEYVKECLRKLHLEEDPRFYFRISEGNDRLTVDIVVNH